MCREGSRSSEETRGLEQTEEGESSGRGGQRPHEVGGTEQGTGCHCEGFTFPAECSHLALSPSPVPCCWLQSSPWTRWGSETSNQGSALGRGGCDPVYMLGPCGSGSSCVLPSSFNSNVSPGWQVTELIRPTRGNPPPNPLLKLGLQEPGVEAPWWPAEAGRCPGGHPGFPPPHISTSRSWRPSCTTSAAPARRPTQRTSSFGTRSVSWLRGWRRRRGSCRRPGGV